MKRTSLSLLLVLALAATAALGQNARRSDDPLSISRRAVPSTSTPSLTFEDPHRGGRAERLRVAEILWGRLVDVHRLRPDGSVDPTPVLVDYLVHEALESDGLRWRLETDGFAGRDRLVLLTSDEAELATLARQATHDLPTVPADATAGSGLRIPRNAALAIRFDDRLDDEGAAARELLDSIRLHASPDGAPISARIFIDRNHGVSKAGAFHPTRVIVDPAISELEAEESPSPLPVNPLGLSGDAELRIPAHGVVRLLQVCDADDAHRGFLADATPPQVVGTWPAAIDSAHHDPGGQLGRDFVIDFRFRSVCREAPEIGDVLSTSSSMFLEVTRPGLYHEGSGIAAGVGVHVLNRRPVSAQSLLGYSQFVTPYDPASPVDVSCWVDFRPHPRRIPVADVSPDARVRVRFSEPIAEESVRPFDTLFVVRGDSATPPNASNVVVGEVVNGWQRRLYTFLPRLPFAHSGAADPYHVVVVGGAGGVVDLAGNPLANELPPVDFTIDPGAPPVENGGLVLRFSSEDEYQVGAAAGALDLRGQFSYDFEHEVIRPRPVSRFSTPADRSNPVPGAMIPFPPGLRTPLVPLGSKLHQAWRYADFGWTVSDERWVNLDVEGLSWSPVAGQVLADFYPEFEMRLAHCAYLPDEAIGYHLLPLYPTSGSSARPSTTRTTSSTTRRARRPSSTPGHWVTR